MDELNRFLRALEQRGFELSRKDGALRLNGPAARLDAPTRERIQSHKDTLLEALDRRQTLYADLLQVISQADEWAPLEEALARAQDAYTDGRLAQAQCEDLARHAREKSRSIPPSWGETHRQQFAQIWGRHADFRYLGETITVVAREDTLPPDHQGVVYTLDEMRRLEGMALEHRRAVHAAKKALDGVVVGDTNQAVRALYGD